MRRRAFILLFTVPAMPVSGLAATGELTAMQPAARVRLSPAELFALADTARSRGDARTAEAAYRALASDAEPEIRAEARFRLAMMFGAIGRFSEAAMLFRQILDEQPGAQRVRLELARMLDLLGDEGAARRALREAQASGLPPDVARFVDRYSAGLRARMPFGASIELALAPDSNINRATRSSTLGTVLGEFTLDEDARQRSGIGAAVTGQAYVRLPLGQTANLLARASGSANLYRDSEFNDVAVGLSAGPEIGFGADRGGIELGVTRRWYGGAPFTTSGNVTVNYRRPLDARSQLHASAGASLVDNHRNRLQDGRSYSLSFGYERALSSRAGAGATIAAERQDARDRGYSITAGQVRLFAYREVGAMTLVGTISYGRLAADERLLLYPRKRADQLYSAGLAATFRQFSIGQFAPLIRITAESNSSSIDINEYRRVRTEFGITRAF
jgi:hypothetical protein